MKTVRIGGNYLPCFSVSVTHMAFTDSLQITFVISPQKSFNSCIWEFLPFFLPKTSRSDILFGGHLECTALLNSTDCQ